jgi:hypothetical protein
VGPGLVLAQCDQTILAERIGVVVPGFTPRDTILSAILLVRGFDLREDRENEHRYGLTFCHGPTLAQARAASREHPTKDPSEKEKLNDLSHG